MEIHQGEQHRGVQRDVQGVLLVRGDVTAGRRGHRQVGGGGGCQVIALIITEPYLLLSSHVNYDWNFFFLSGFYLDGGFYYLGVISPTFTTRTAKQSHMKWRR